MIKKKRTKVTREQKERITLASLEPKSDLNELARKYKLACSTLIKWKRQHTQKQEEEARLQPDSSFVEVIIPDVLNTYDLIVWAEKHSHDIVTQRKDAEGSLRMLIKP